jgi:hypothetical protein
MHYSKRYTSDFSMYEGSKQSFSYCGKLNPAVYSHYSFNLSDLSA